MVTRTEIIEWLGAPSAEPLFERARAVKRDTVGEQVYLRGLVELSNRCRKECFYCGIRGPSTRVTRYELTDSQVLAAAEYACQHRFGSLVLQAGERCDEAFVARVEALVRQIKTLGGGALGVTLSLGEQSEDTYRRWFEAGAHRYLLRIETSSPSLYARLHPASHRLDHRIECLHRLQRVGYQLGTGVMIGLPGQTLADLADDLLFFQSLDIDMCGMGPYIEHPDTPLAGQPVSFSRVERLELSLRMIALLRILMPDINIAATTALHALDPQGRERGIAAGANVVMPNLTPAGFRQGYKLYEGKPLDDLRVDAFEVAYGDWGDSLHARRKRSAGSGSR